MGGADARSAAPLLPMRLGDVQLTDSWPQPGFHGCAFPHLIRGTVLARSPINGHVPPGSAIPNRITR
jgi:hypothetical protein